MAPGALHGLQVCTHRLVRAPLALGAHGRSLQCLNKPQPGPERLLHCTEGWAAQGRYERPRRLGAGAASPATASAVAGGHRSPTLCTAAACSGARSPHAADSGVSPRIALSGRTGSVHRPGASLGHIHPRSPAAHPEHYKAFRVRDQARRCQRRLVQTWPSSAVRAGPVAHAFRPLVDQAVVCETDGMGWRLPAATFHAACRVQHTGPYCRRRR